MRQRARYVVTGVLALALALPAAAPAAPEGQLTLATHFSIAPTFFDPAETPGLITPFILLYALHDALVKPMPGKSMAPSLAESWSVSSDGLVYEFALRKGTKFHTGDPVTAEDVKFSFERYRGIFVAGLKRGDADIAYGFDGTLADEVRRTPGLTLRPTPFTSTHWLVFADQWDPKSPWHDRRVRLAANHAVNHQAINQAEALGFAKITGSIIPSSYEFYWQPTPYAYDPARARQLLAEAGYPGGFDAGD